MSNLNKIKKLEKFIKRLPEPEQNRTIILVEDKFLTWKQVLEGLKKKGELADKIEKKFLNYIND